MKQYPKRVECKWHQHDIVWILGIGFSNAQRAIVIKADCEDGPPAKYDVMLLDKGKNEVDPDAGSVTICGLEEYRMYEKPIGAARELYQIRADEHCDLGHDLRNCTEHWDDADYIFRHLGEKRDV